MASNLCPNPRTLKAFSTDVKASCPVNRISAAPMSVRTSPLLQHRSKRIAKVLVQASSQEEKEAEDMKKVESTCYTQGEIIFAPGRLFEDTVVSNNIYGPML